MNVSKRMHKGYLHTQIGTPYYMSPEIWNNRPYDASSDIWSLGCMMYELCKLHPPFQGNSFPELKRNVISGRFSPIPRKYSDNLHNEILLLENKKQDSDKIKEELDNLAQQLNETQEELTKINEEKTYVDTVREILSEKRC